MKEVVQAS